MYIIIQLYKTYKIRLIRLEIKSIHTEVFALREIVEDV